MAEARVYQAGAILVYYSTGSVELTQVVADDLNVFTDAIATALVGNLTLSLEEDLSIFTDSFSSQMFGILVLSLEENADVFTDSIDFWYPDLIFTESINFLADELVAIGFNYALILSDGIPALSDGLILSFLYSLEIEDDLSLFTDAIVSDLFGYASTGVLGDDINNYSDEVGMILHGYLVLEDFLPIGFGPSNDSIKFNLSYENAFEDNINNLDDSVGLQLQHELTLSVADDINVLSDFISVEDNVRSVGASRGLFLNYIRRYLNDAGSN